MQSDAIDGGSLVNLTTAWAQTLRDKMSALDMNHISRVIQTLDEMRFALAGRWQGLAWEKEHDAVQNAR